ncbi:hypothetical protein DFJ77DRAFT_204079 [Powellomyces hirtus]|nr:hypothetical protein DFJ77DRAFT_204079 [Powellomyces hirtus]
MLMLAPSGIVRSAVLIMAGVEVLTLQTTLADDVEAYRRAKLDCVLEIPKNAEVYGVQPYRIAEWETDTWKTWQYALRDELMKKNLVNFPTGTAVQIQDVLQDHLLLICRHLARSADNKFARLLIQRLEDPNHAIGYSHTMLRKKRRNVDQSVLDKYLDKYAGLVDGLDLHSHRWESSTLLNLGLHRT